MAADQLATPQDLASLLQLDYTTLSATQQATMAMLVEMATGLIQDVAGQRIIQITDTAVIDVMDWSAWLDLPQKPINAVATVLLDGVAITDWVLRSQRLFRLVGWQTQFLTPAQATVTYTHGLAPGAQYLQTARLMCLSLGQVGYGRPNPTVSSEAIDDYKVTYADALARMVDSMTEFMAERIRNAYGASAYVTSSY